MLLIWSPAGPFLLLQSTQPRTGTILHDQLPPPNPRSAYITAHAVAEMPHRGAMLKPLRPYLSIDIFILLAGYIILDWVSYISPVHGLSITPWNPAPALGLLYLLHFGKHATAPLALAILIADAWVRNLPLAFSISVVLSVLPDPRLLGNCRSAAPSSLQLPHIQRSPRTIFLGVHRCYRHDTEQSAVRRGTCRRR